MAAQERRKSIAVGIVGGPKTPKQIIAQRRLENIQEQINEVIGIMGVNVNKVMEKDKQLSKLTDSKIINENGRNDIEDGTNESTLHTKLRNHWCWNLKMMLFVMAVIGIIIVLIIIGIAFFRESKNILSNEHHTNITVTLERHTNGKADVVQVKENEVIIDHGPNYVQAGKTVLTHPKRISTNNENDETDNDNLPELIKKVK